MTKTYTWTTPKGANIEMTVTVNHITSEMVNADGNLIEVACDRWERTVDACRLNGKDTAMKELDYVNGKRAIIIARNGRQEICAELPEYAIKGIYGNEIAANAAKLDAAIKAEKAYEAHRTMVLKAMGGQA